MRDTRHCACFSHTEEPTPNGHMPWGSRLVLLTSATGVAPGHGLSWSQCPTVVTGHPTPAGHLPGPKGARLPGAVVPAPGLWGALEPWLLGLKGPPPPQAGAALGSPRFRRGSGAVVSMWRCPSPRVLGTLGRWTPWHPESGSPVVSAALVSQPRGRARRAPRSQLPSRVPPVGPPALSPLPTGQVTVALRLQAFSLFAPRLTCVCVANPAVRYRCLANRHSARCNF